MTAKPQDHTEVDHTAVEDTAIKAAQKRRSIALALALAAFAALFYVLTIVKMGPGLFDRPM